MGKIRDLFKKLKHYFGVEDLLSENSIPTIEIHKRHDSHSAQHSQPVVDTPQIKIGEIHKRDSTVVSANVYQSEVDVQNPNLGHGITVKKQRKPGRCPLCATKGKVVENITGNDRWKCEECGSTFN